MSHLTTCKAVITDLDALEEAIKKLPIPIHWKMYKLKPEFIRDQKEFTWYNGKKAPCEHLVRLKFHNETYDIGIVARKDGGWNLQWDNVLNPYVGNEANKLMALYAEEVCNKYAADTGSLIQKTELEDGNLRIELIQV